MRKRRLTRDAEATVRRGVAVCAVAPATAVVEDNLAKEETALPAAAMMVAIADDARHGACTGIAAAEVSCEWQGGMRDAAPGAGD